MSTFNSKNQDYLGLPFDNANFNISFSSEKENPWEVAIKSVNEWLARWDEIKKGGDKDFKAVIKDDEEYSLSVDAAYRKRTDGYNTQYATRPTRSINTIKGYMENTAELDKIDEYGGLMDEAMKQEATGFFYVKKIGDRWWNIDPLGYPMFKVGINSVQMGKEKDKHLARYGNTQGWAQATTTRLRELGFNSFGGWCPITNFISNDNALAQTQIFTIMGYYIRQNISEGIADLIHPSFDPQFAVYADKEIANAVQEYVNSPKIYGWISDNELRVSEKLLENSLTLDPKDPSAVYTYATAWTFMYLKTGKADVSLADVTEELSLEYRAMSFDKYFSIVASLTKKHDPNHMYMGCRFHGSGLTDESLFRVAGYWCDVITYNYYSSWTANFELVANQARWSGKPFVVTEFYAKGMDEWEKDNTMINKDGAGWTVRTQADRGKFYQNFALSLLECGGCVGFDWFKYNNKANSNMGIVDYNAEEYTELTNQMKEVNTQKYNLIKFFDAR